MVVLSALLLGVVFAYLILANSVFREDKELLVFDTNRSSTERVSNELDGLIRRVVDKMEVLAQLLAYSPSQSNKILGRSLFDEDPDLIAFQLIGANGKNSTVLRELVSAEKINRPDAAPNRADINLPEILPLDRPEPLEIEIENRSTANRVLFVIRIPIKTAEKRGLYAQALIDGQSWLINFYKSQGLSLTFVTAQDGKVFAHPDLKLVLNHQDMRFLKIVELALSRSFMLQQTEFKEGKHTYLGVYRKTTLGSLVVVSMTDMSIVLAAGRLLLEKTIILSAIIITVVFIISLIFARTLSAPLLRLVNATHEIARGNFDTRIRIETGDEIGVLAQGFSQMARELKSSRILLEEYNRDLELRVQQRTGELESKNVAIRNQQEMLIKATRLAAVGETAGQAAHEVLNPLTAMVSTLEAATYRLQQFSNLPNAAVQVFKAIIGDWKKELDESGVDHWMQSMKRTSQVLSGKTLVQEDIENLRLICEQFESFSEKLGGDFHLLIQESHRIGRIVESMRGLSRTVRLKSRTELTELIFESVKVTEDMLKRYSIEIRTEFKDSPIFVMADADEIKQVFLNLIKNAMDAIEQRRKENAAVELRGEIKISLWVNSDDILVRIRDNGIGLSEQNQRKLFEPSFSTKGNEGTGFGLSICRRFIREAGGDLILYKSEPGEFAEFELKLPRLNDRKREQTPEKSG